MIDKPLLPVNMQSTPSRLFFSFTCRDLIEARVSIGFKPEFSANVRGMASRASANARMAYCSIPGLFKTVSRVVHHTKQDKQTLTAASSTAIEHAISAAPPP